MRHDTSSAIDDAAECVIGVGSDAWLNRDFVPSYVVKKAPAWDNERLRQERSMDC